MAALLDGFIPYAAGAAHDGLLGSVSPLVSRVINQNLPIKLLERGEYEELFRQRLMPTKAFQTYMKLEGFDLDNFNPANLNIFENDKDKILTLGPTWEQTNLSLFEVWMLGQTHLPSEDQITLWLQRGWISQDLAVHWLRRHGIKSLDQIGMMLKQVNEYPTAQDLIQFSVRHGFEPDILTTFGYAQEIPSNYLKWAKAIGLGGSSEVTISNATDENGNPIPQHDATWAEQHWFAHWILPSLGDAYEMLHRLYPESDFGPSPDWKQGLDFTPDLLSLFQRAQDIPKYWRDRLQAISFLPLSRVDVRRMYNLDIIDDAGVYHSYRAQGYNDARAKDLLKYAQAAKQDQINQRIGVPKEKALCELYTIGIITDDEVRDFAKLLHVPETNINDLIHNCNLDATKKRIKTIESAMHKGYLKGVLKDDEVKATLSDLQIRDDAINDLLTQWEIEQQFEFKEISAKDAQSWFESGVITEQEFVARLQNLKLDDGAILAMVQLSRAKIITKQLSELEKQLKEEQARIKQGARELKAKQKEEIAAQKDRVKALLASSTQTNLKTWWKAGLISENEVIDRLTMLDYPIIDIQRWLTAYRPKAK